jgi:hypothetical protein
MSQDEKTRFEELIKNVPNFFMPKRCGECRRKRRLAKNQGLPYLPPVKLAAAPVEVPVEIPVDVPIEVPSKEPRIILVSQHFEELILGHPVVLNGIRIILAEIGFDVMRKAIDRAEVEKAKAILKKNGIVSG